MTAQLKRRNPHPPSGMSNSDSSVQLSTMEYSDRSPHCPCVVRGLLIVTLAVIVCWSTGCQYPRQPSVPVMTGVSVPSPREFITETTPPITEVSPPEPSRSEPPPPEASPTAVPAPPSSESVSAPPETSPADSPATNPVPEPAPITQPPISYSQKYDAEVKAIIALASRNRWEEALESAQQLLAHDSTDPAVVRVHDWISSQTESIRSKALEDTIRKIDSRSSVFSPTIPGLLTEIPDRGLPPRKELRDAVQDIESAPYVPSSYNQFIKLNAPDFDYTRQTGRMAKELNKPVSLKFEDLALKSIIFEIGKKENINFVADQSLKAFEQKIHVNFDQVRLGEFLEYISRNFDLQFMIGNDLIYVIDGSDTKKTIEETRIYRLRKGFILPARFGEDEVNIKETKAKDGTVTTETNLKGKSFVKDGVSATPAIEKAIIKFFKGSDYEIDYEHNLIIATGTREQLAELEKIIEAYDRPLQQVLIEARFITVSEASFMQMGALWETGRPDVDSAQPPIDYLGFGPENVGRSLQETFRDNLLDRDNLSLTLNALEQEGETRTLSAPRITVVNNLPAKISDGKIQHYYEEYTVSQTINERNIVAALVPTGKPQQITSGVSLEVMASIGGDGKTIYLALFPEVNQDVRLVPFATVADSSGNSFEIRLPESRTQSMSTRVIVQSGQTVVMGGVLEREQSTYVDSVPILGKLPFIGAAFRRRTELDKPRYLLIFVTATLLSETGEFIEVVEAKPKATEPLP